MNLSTAPVVGGATPALWPQVFQRHESGTFFLASFCVGQDGNTAKEVGKQIVSELEALPISRVVDFATQLHSLVEAHKSEIQSFAAAMFTDERVLAWTFGNGAVMLRRGEKTGTVVQSQAMKVVEGKVRTGDFFAVGTTGFFSLIPGSFLDEAGTPEELAEILVPKLHLHGAESGAAAFIAHVHAGESATLLGVDDIARRKELSAKVRGMLSGVLSFPSTVRNVINRRGEFRRHLPDRNTRIKIIVVFVAALVLVVSMIVWGRRQAAVRDGRVQAVVGPLQQQLDEAKSIQHTELGRAREISASLLDQTRAALDQTAERSPERRAVEEFLAGLESYYSEISGVQDIGTLQTFYNLQLVKSDFLAGRVAIGEGSLYFLDTGTTSAVQLEISRKQPTSLTTDGVTAPKDIAFLNDEVYILGDGIFRGNNAVVERTNAWSDPVLMESFGQNLYVLDRGTRELRRYVGSEGGFTGGTNWIRSAAGLDFGDVSSLAIDGEVWIGTSNGDMFRFTQGNGSRLQPEGLPAPFSSTIVVYTNGDLERLYVLEPSAQRLVVLDKTGALVKVYTANEIGAASDLVVDTDTGTAFLTAGSVVYSVDLE